MSTSAEQIDWRAVAAEYRKRIHSICTFAAFGCYFAMALGLAKLLEIFRLSTVWVENIALIAWLPLGVVAYWIKNRLEDWSDKGIPRP
jgi:hypothetical protein